MLLYVLILLLFLGLRRKFPALEMKSCVHNIPIKVDFFPQQRRDEFYNEHCARGDICQPERLMFDAKTHAWVFGILSSSTLICTRWSWWNASASAICSNSMASALMCWMRNFDLYTVGVGGKCSFSDSIDIYISHIISCKRWSNVKLAFFHNILLRLRGYTMEDNAESCVVEFQYVYVHKRKLKSLNLLSAGAQNLISSNKLISQFSVCMQPIKYWQRFMT